MKKLLTLLLAIAFLFQSCGNGTEKKATEKIQQTTQVIEKDNIEDDNTEMNDEPDEDDFVYPETGNKASDFMPKMTIYDYDIQYEAKGDLNNDGLEDIVVILRNKEIKTAQRPMLILLRNKDKTYRLDKVSNVTMPKEYNEHDFKLYDTEDISIENGELKIQLYSIGPSGNCFADFKYFGNELVLVSYEGYFRGAGGHSSLTYDFEKEQLTANTTDFIDDEETTSSEIIPLKKKKYLFENTSITDLFNEE